MGSCQAARGLQSTRCSAVYLQKKLLLAGLSRPLKWNIVAYQIWMSYCCCSRIAFVIRKLKLIYSLLICSAGMWHWDSLQENQSTGKRLKWGIEKTPTTNRRAHGCRAEHKHTANKMLTLSQHNYWILCSQLKLSGLSSFQLLSIIHAHHFTKRNTI